MMIEFFRYLNSLQPLSPEATSGIMKVIRTKELRRGQVWLQEGAVCDKMTFVVKGLLKLYFETETKELILQFAKEEDWIVAANSYFGKLPGNYSIRCVEPSIVLHINKSDLDNLLARHIELNMHFKIIAERQVRLLEDHASLLMLTHKERYFKLMAQNSWIITSGRITDRLLAWHLGMTSNTLCSLKKS